MTALLEVMAFLRLAGNFNPALWPVGTLVLGLKSQAIGCVEALESGLLLSCYGFCSMLYVTLVSIKMGKMNKYLNEASVQPMQQGSARDGILEPRVRWAEAAGRAWAMCFGYAGIWVGSEGVPSPFLCLIQERYYVLYIQPSCIHRRKFDPKGNEIEPNFSATRKVNTGFLMSSYSRYPGLFLF